MIKQIVTAIMLLCGILCRADDRQVSEITDLIFKNQKSFLSGEPLVDKSRRFDELMEDIGEEEFKRNESGRLNPAVYQDRIRLIALYRFQHNDLFEEIYKTYVRHPTDAEIEKMRQAFIAKNPETEEDKKFQREINPSGARLVRVDPRFPAPDSIQEAHLAPKYRFCFEYFWMAPVHEATMKRFENAMDRALDHFKNETGDADIRELIQAKIKNSK
jgi:hypothetical protein